MGSSNTCIRDIKQTKASFYSDYGGSRAKIFLYKIKYNMLSLFTWIRRYESRNVYIMWCRKFSETYKSLWWHSIYSPMWFVHPPPPWKWIYFPKPVYCCSADACPTTIQHSSEKGVKVAVPAKTRHSPNAGLLLCHRLRRWPNSKPALGDCLVFGGGGGFRE